MFGEKRVESKSNKFLKLTSEKEDINQYWFSEKTIDFIVGQVQSHLNKDDVNFKIAFVSTPSIFFSCDESVKAQSVLFDFDERLVKKHKNGIKFDFNDFSELVKNEELINSFDYVMVDPPYINEPSWTKFAEFVTLISKKDEEGKIKAKILTCSIAENKDMLKRLLNLDIKKYQPSIPHLVYQYNFFSNYEDELLNELNSEIIID